MMVSAFPGMGTQPNYGYSPYGYNMPGYNMPGYGFPGMGGDPSSFYFGGQSPYGGYPPYGGQSPFGGFPPYGGQSPFGGFPPYGGQSPFGGGYPPDMSIMWGFFQYMMQMMGCHCDQGGDAGGHDPKGAEKNSEILKTLQDYNMLEAYSMDGKITKQSLEMLANSWQAPEEARRAAKELAENKELFNLLTLASGDDPSDKAAGIDLKLIKKGNWEELHVDDLDPKTQSIEVLKEHADAIAKLDQNPENISFEELQKIALGEVDDATLKTPEMRSAALKVLSDRKLRKALDEYDDADPNTKPENTKEEQFNKNAFAEWLAAHEKENEDHGKDKGH